MSKSSMDFLAMFFLSNQGLCDACSYKVRFCINFSSNLFQLDKRSSFFQKKTMTGTKENLILKKPSSFWEINESFNYVLQC